MRLAVVSPFLDKRHGTERCIAEQVERLARDYGCDIDIVSERVEDVDLYDDAGTAGRPYRGRIVWHRVRAAAGPQLIRYVWWFVANHWVRFRKGRRGERYDIVYSPGINCFDADVISVHIVFREFYEKVASELPLRSHPYITWPRLLHRRAYYWLIMTLERVVYRNGRTVCAAVSKKTAADLARWYSKRSNVVVSYHGIDGRFSPVTRNQMRAKARSELGLSDDVGAILLIGNDWRKKGLATLLEAVGGLDDSRLRLLIVGEDEPKLFEDQILRSGLQNQILFLPVRRDVEIYYAAADYYIGASLEDAFALPVAEAMACGLPVIVSSRAGVREIITDGVDALVLNDPKNPTELATLIRRLVNDPEFSRRLGEQAATTASAYSWDRNTAELHALICEAAARKERQE